MRDGNPPPSEITSFINKGDSFYFGDIYSEDIEIDSTFSIDVRLKKELDWINIINLDTFTIVLIDTEFVDLEDDDQSFELEFESFNSQSDDKPTLRTDKVIVNL